MTKLLFANKILLDRKSFVSLNYDEPHLFLHGLDKVLQREKVWKKSKGKCGRCKATLDPENWVWDHVQGGNVGRCDCLHNSQALCIPCDAIKTRESEHH